jgi:hypothetical protein
VLSFFRWLQIQGARADPVGDLARVARADPAWPTRSDALSRLDRYLRQRGAPLPQRRALRRAYGEWLIATANELG